MSGTLLFKPGDEIPVYLTEDGNGDLPEPGDGVEITGENNEYTEVARVAAAGNVGIGVVEQTPSDADGNAVAGMGTVVSDKTIVCVNETDAAGLAAGDEVQEDAGGSYAAFAGAATQATTPAGQVFSAAPSKYDLSHGDRVAVALYR